MAILKIAKMGHPVLAARAREIEDPRAPQIRALVRDMIETMEDAEGTGLAAPQVHVPLRLLVYFVEGERASAEGGQEPAPDEGEQAGVPLTALVNPQITPLGDAQELGWEGCLSVPGLMGLVPRYSRVHLKAQDLEGRVVEREVDGFHARVLQHEYDHLDGILYPQRMTDLSKLIFSSEMKHLAAAQKAAQKAAQQAAQQAAAERGADSGTGSGSDSLAEGEQ
jgi:peptide deformylase